MVDLDSRWHVPASYAGDLDFGGHVLRQRGAPAAPALNMLSFLAVEQRLAEQGPFSALAWQLIADEDAAVIDAVHHLLETPTVDRLACAHVMQVVADPDQRAFEVAKQAWHSTREASGSDRVAAGLMLGTSAMRVAADKAAQFLDKIEPGLVHATPLQRAVYALIRATIDASPALLDEAYRRFAELDDHFGLAQCALVAYQRELATEHRPALLRGYLEHAIYRYDIGRRESWAARTITYVLIPLLVDVLRAASDDVAGWLQRAATFATGSQSLAELRSVFRIANKLGFRATVATLEPSDAPRFERLGAATGATSGAPAATPATSEPAATPAPAAAAAPSADAEKKPKRKGKGKGAKA